MELPDNLRGLLARNLETLMEKVPALDSQPKISDKGKFSQSTAGRVLRAESALNLDNLEALAKAANLDPWQLLVPGLDPINKPELALSKSERESLAKIRQIVANTPVDAELFTTSGDMNTPATARKTAKR